MEGGRTTMGGFCFSLPVDQYMVKNQDGSYYPIEYLTRSNQIPADAAEWDREVFVELQGNGAVLRCYDKQGNIIEKPRMIIVSKSTIFGIVPENSVVSEV